MFYCYLVLGLSPFCRVVDGFADIEKRRDRAYAGDSGDQLLTHTFFGFFFEIFGFLFQLLFELFTGGILQLRDQLFLCLFFDLAENFVDLLLYGRFVDNLFDDLFFNVHSALLLLIL